MKKRNYTLHIKNQVLSLLKIPDNKGQKESK